MTRPKMKPCPYCKSDEGLCIMRYDSGWKHVECHACSYCYMGPGCGSMLDAVRSHNEYVDKPATIANAARLVENFNQRNPLKAGSATVTSDQKDAG